MMCHAMRERMLDADIDELEGRGTSLLAAHVRECASCAAVARGIVRDTRVLASVANRSRGGVVTLAPRRRRGGRYLMIGSAAAAIAAGMVVIAGSRSAVERSIPTLVAATPKLVALPDSSRAIEADRFPDAEPVVAVPMAQQSDARLTMPQPEAGVVRADPLGGVRAAVMQTSNPSITVVVLYKPSSGPEK